MGAGAMGSIFGATTSEAGHETVLLDVDRGLVEKLNADGVRIVARDGGERRVAVKATTEASSVGAVDIVVFCVKCYHTASAAAAALELVGPETVVVSLQNGWGNGEVLAAHYRAEQLVVGVTYNSGTVLELGKVGHLGVGPTLVGPYQGEAAEGAERVAAMLSESGLAAEVAIPVRPEIWRKLIVNAAALPAAALINATAVEMVEHDGLRALVDETAREAVRVAQALGYEIEEDERAEYIRGLLERAGATRGSMVQDIAAGRRTEIEVINGAVVRAGDELGVPVPVNRALVALVAGWESVRGLV